MAAVQCSCTGTGALGSKARAEDAILRPFSMEVAAAGLAAAAVELHHFYCKWRSLRHAPQGQRCPGAPVLLRTLAAVSAVLVVVEALADGPWLQVGCGSLPPMPDRHTCVLHDTEKQRENGRLPSVLAP